MKAENISLIIHNVCQHLGIQYDSKNPHFLTLQEDALKMRKIYLKLKQITGILQEIEDRHDLNDFREMFDNIIKAIENADHQIIRLATRLKDLNNE